MSSKELPPAPPHITWDEAAILQHESEAGVLYGTQRVEEAVTPFLYSGVETPGADGDGTKATNSSDLSDVPRLNPDDTAQQHGTTTTTKTAPRRTIGEHVPGVGRREVDVSELRERLGVCLDSMRDPPPPWLKMKSRSEDPGAVFYFNTATNVTSWDFPEEELEEEGSMHHGLDGVGDGAVRGAVKEKGKDEEDKEEEEEEDEPVVESRLTRAQDCAAQFASKHR